MNSNLLNSEVQDFIHKNIKADLSSLVLKGSPFAQITIQELADQIRSKAKCEQKLPTWFNTAGIYYPKPIQIEQTSSESTGTYKSSLVSGSSLIDLTGGFGVDSYFFSKKIKHVTHCEIDNNLSTIVTHNFKALQVNNVLTKNDDGIGIIQNTEQSYDWIYIDPSRRNDHKGKVFKLEDCLPDVSLHLDTFLSHSANIMIKLSPLLDLSATIKSLNFVKEIHIIAVKNEVKELLVLVEKEYKDTPILKCININKGIQDYFEGSFGSVSQARYSRVRKYLFEPNASILKSGLFNEVSSKLDVYKLHINSHLYTSDDLKPFPGRRFEILSVFKYNKKLLKRVLNFGKANITTRNFHDSVAQIRKKTGLKEGGSDYLFFTTDMENKAIVIHCIKV